MQTLTPLEPRRLINSRSIHEYTHRAIAIKRTLGIRRAAGYLRNRGVSVEAAVWLLTRHVANSPR